MEIRTTTELKALRLLLGLDPSEMAALIGMDKKALLDAERGREWNISPRHRDELLRYEQSVQELITEIDASNAQYVIVYPNDDVYREFEPEWSEKLPLALMHLKACSRAKAELEGDQAVINAASVTLVTMMPKSYEEYRYRDAGGQVFPDNAQTRQMWAEAYCKNYRVMEEAR